MDDARAIGENDHSWRNHSIPDITTQDESTDMIYKTIRFAPEHDRRLLSNGGTAYWNEKRRVVVIRDLGLSSGTDGGSAFAPPNGRAYFERML